MTPGYPGPDPQREVKTQLSMRDRRLKTLDVSCLATRPFKEPQKLSQSPGGGQAAAAVFSELCHRGPYSLHVKNDQKKDESTCS